MYYDVLCILVRLRPNEKYINSCFYEYDVLVHRTIVHTNKYNILYHTSTS